MTLDMRGMEDRTKQEHLRIDVLDIMVLIIVVQGPCGRFGLAMSAC